MAELLTRWRAGALLIPAHPPDEVMRAVARASRACERLQDEGRRLRFSLEHPDQRVAIEVLDLHGNVTGALSPSQALAIAEGAPLP